MLPSLRSPWWYRRRGLLIGAVYALGFAVGYLPHAGPPAEPVCVVLGGWWHGAGTQVLLWGGVLSVLVAWLLRSSGTAFLRQEVVFADAVQPDRLIVAGPFRYLRNPLYLGNLFLALGVGVLASPLGCAIILLGNAAIVVALAAEEARHLRARYGAVYDAYAAAVPAFVPRRTPAEVPGSGEAAPSYLAGALGESGILALALAMVPLVVFGEAGLPAFWLAWIGLGLIGWSVSRWLGRRNTPGTTR